MIKAVIFDWFNTLARYEPSREEVHSRVLHDFGIEVVPDKLTSPFQKADSFFFDESAKFPVRNRTPEEQAELYSHYEEILLTEAGIQFDKKVLPDIFKKGNLAFSKVSDFVLFDDVLPVLKDLDERKYTIGLLTNLSKDMDSLCRKLGMEKYLDFIVTPFEAGADKPDPAIFRMALHKAGVKAEEVVYIGDQYKIDILGARGVGIEPVLIDRYNISGDMKDCPRITSLVELNRYLNE